MTQNLNDFEELLKWYRGLTPAQKCTVHPPAGSGAGYGLYNRSDKDLAESFIRQQKKSNPKQVFPGYWFSDEHGHDVTVLAVVGNFCMVEDDDKDEPYVLPLEFIQAIKEASDEANSVQAQ